jgi:hypothetical protein
MRRGRSLVGPRRPVPPPSGGGRRGKGYARRGVVDDDDVQPVAGAFDADLGVGGVGMLRWWSLGHDEVATASAREQRMGDRNC